jgi:hypothetical protein
MIDINFLEMILSYPGFRWVKKVRSTLNTISMTEVNVIAKINLIHTIGSRDHAATESQGKTCTGDK